MLRTRRAQGSVISEEIKFESPFFPLCNQGEVSWAETWEEIGKVFPWHWQHPQGGEPTALQSRRSVSLSQHHRRGGQRWVLVEPLCLIPENSAETFFSSSVAPRGFQQHPPPL